MVKKIKFLALACLLSAKGFATQELDFQADSRAAVAPTNNVYVVITQRNVPESNGSASNKMEPQLVQKVIEQVITSVFGGPRISGLIAASLSTTHNLTCTIWDSKELAWAWAGTGAHKELMGERSGGTGVKFFQMTYAKAPKSITESLAKFSC